MPLSCSTTTVVYVLALTLQVDNELHTFDSSVISGGILVDPST